jgi:hypothetical protein
VKFKLKNKNYLNKKIKIKKSLFMETLFRNKILIRKLKSFKNLLKKILKNSKDKIGKETVLIIIKLSKPQRKMKKKKKKY